MFVTKTMFTFASEDSGRHLGEILMAVSMPYYRHTSELAYSNRHGRKFVVLSDG